ncbi:MAG: hypothetical protein ACFFDN_37520 [Candidatus Hodarchaeota archaeon]
MTPKVTVQDEIYYEPISFKILTHKEYKKYFLNNNYYFIIKLVKDGYLTVSEIHKEYPVEIEKKKSKNTIYRYIQELIKAGILSEVGRRIQSNQISTQILYGLNAKFILINNNAVNIWRSERGNVIADTIRIMLHRHLNNKSPELSPFIEFLLKIDENNTHMQKQLLEQVITKLESTEIPQNEKEILEQILKGINTFDAEEYLYFQLLLYDISWILSKDTLNKKIKQFYTINLTELPREIDNKPSLTSKSQKDYEFHDVIINHPHLIKIIEKKEWQFCFDNPNYGAVTEILKDGPMTIKEIHNRHHEVVIERLKRKLKEGEKFKIPRPKKENTVYRYVKDLIKAGFVIEAGRRILPNQTYTPLLYSRIAKIYGNISDDQEFLNSEKGRNVTNIIGQLLQQYLNKRNVDQTRFHSIILEFDKEKRLAIEQAFYSETISWISDLIFSFDDIEYDLFFESLSRIEWLIVMRDNEKFELLMDCFSN